MESLYSLEWLDFHRLHQYLSLIHIEMCIRDSIYSQCSADYDVESPITTEFFAIGSSMKVMVRAIIVRSPDTFHVDSMPFLSLIHI